MSEAKRCPQCGAALPESAFGRLCPACLLQQGVASETAPKPASEKFVPPAPAEIAAHFPQLEILELLGQGGMGAVYKARQKELDRFVALKILPPTAGQDPGFAERFAREARALARLNHPGIVAIHDFGQVEVGQASSLSPAGKQGTGKMPVPLYYLLMEYVDGLNLRQLLRTPKLEPQEAVAIVPQICDALQFAHDEGIVHRDIKPENILLDKKGRVKIADFGLAKILGKQPADFTITGAGEKMGTPHYMAPEQIEKPGEVDHRADIYSLGVVFYEMLTGELPLGRFAPPSQKIQIDVRLDEVVLRALAKEPARRYQQASELKTGVETILTTPPAGSRGAEAHSAAPSQKPDQLQDFWLKLKKRLWPPLVIRRHGQRVINWPAMALGLVRVLFVAVLFGLGLGLAVGIKFGEKTGIEAGLGYIGLLGILAGFKIIIRLLRGYAKPLNELPEFGGSAGVPPAEPGIVPGSSFHKSSGVAALVLCLAAVPAVLLLGWFVHRSLAAVLIILAAFLVLEVGALVAGIIGWKSGWGKAAVIVAGLVLVLSVPVIVFLAWEISPPLARDATGTVSALKVVGTVTDAATGQPIAGARVADVVYGASPARAPQETWTDTTGHFELHTWYEEHTLAASAPGYETKLATLATKFLGSERQVRLDFQLARAGGRADNQADGPVSDRILAEPPQLRFLAYQGDRLDAATPRAWYPDGRLVRDPRELQLLRTIQPVGLTGVYPQDIRFLHLWFSHPAVDLHSVAQVTFLAPNGQPISSARGDYSSGTHPARKTDGEVGWLYVTMSPGHGAIPPPGTIPPDFQTELPPAVDVVLHYSVGPWSDARPILADFRGTMALGDGAYLSGGIGQNRAGRGFITIVQEGEKSRRTQFDFTALTRDGRRLLPSGTSGGGPAPVIAEQFEFNAPLDQIQGFEWRTRPIRTATFHNVSLWPGHPPKKKAD